MPPVESPCLSIMQQTEGQILEEVSPRSAVKESGLCCSYPRGCSLGGAAGAAAGVPGYLRPGDG